MLLCVFLCEGFSMWVSISYNILYKFGFFVYIMYYWVLIKYKGFFFKVFSYCRWKIRMIYYMIRSVGWNRECLLNKLLKNNII